MVERTSKAIAHDQLLNCNKILLIIVLWCIRMYSSGLVHTNICLDVHVYIIV